MSSLTHAETALLGLLAEGPAHAWRLQKAIEYREMRTWTDLSQSTIYKQLRSLEQADFVSVAEEVVEGRLRKVYSVTSAGREALADALLGLLGEPQWPTQPIDIATYNVDLAPKPQVLEALATYGKRLRESAECWRQLEVFLQESECPSHRMAIARRSIRMIEGELVWLDEFTKELSAT